MNCEEAEDEDHTESKEIEDETREEEKDEDDVNTGREALD
jgi:hypothetical protein